MRLWIPAFAGMAQTDPKLVQRTSQTPPQISRAHFSQSNELSDHSAGGPAL